MTATVPVLTAANGEAWEAAFVGRSGDAAVGAVVVARCLDVVDLLATAQTGRARVAVIAASLRHLDREAIARLHALGLAAVVVVDGPATAPRWRDLGADVVIDDRIEPEALGQAVAQALSPAPAAVDPAGGRLVTVWGPAGAPGRSTVALAVADELAASGLRTVLIDADPYGGSLATQLGLLDEAPGLVAAVRAASSGALDVASVSACAAHVGDLAVLTGLARADRWPELRESAVAAVLEAARRAAAIAVVDAGFCLEADEEISYDLPAPRRNGPTLTAIAAADVVVAVAAADPLGLQRFLRALPEVRALLRPDAELRVVVNKARDSAIGGRDAHRQVGEALLRHGGVTPAAVLPFDVDACDRTLLGGRTLREAAPTSALRAALRAFAGELAGVAPPARRRRAR
ncbi:MAG TPA: hypothetical protein VHE83_04450 [Mycobacteriales bacterium]|nr:hypothetical protein [Mycobacteriales bacterium]